MKGCEVDGPKNRPSGATAWRLPGRTTHLSHGRPRRVDKLPSGGPTSTGCAGEYIDPCLLATGSGVNGSANGGAGSTHPLAGSLPTRTAKLARNARYPNPSPWK